MEEFCRGCLVQYNDPSELIPYTEKNRRLFIYCTGIQVKVNDRFTFQLCKDCHLNMQVSSKFKKLCHNSDRKIKKYFGLQDVGENIDLPNFLKTSDDSITFRHPLLGNSTQSNNNGEDEDNESTCTSIQNFIDDIMASEEIPATEARIIREVIEEEADVLDYSLDSHWLQDDESIDKSFKFDFSFSPFATPQYTNEDGSKFLDDFIKKKPDDDATSKIPADIILKTESKLEECDDMETNCTIDQNLENALQNENNDSVYLEDLLVTPPIQTDISGPPTPFINNILFGEKLESDSENCMINKIEKYLQEFKPVQCDNDSIEEILADTVKEFDIGDSDVEMSTEILKEQNTYKHKGEIKQINKSDLKTKQVEKKCSSPDENKYSVTNFYCKMCKKQFKNLAALKVHCGRKHKLRINYKPEKPTLRIPRICDYCGKMYNRLNSLIRHIKSHNKIPRYLVCQICSLKFSSEAKLNMHQSTHKTKSIEEKNKKKYVCTICGAGSSSATNLKTHIRRHSKSYTLNCDECGMGFYRKTDLTIHYRHHTGEKPYPCEHCYRKFARRDVLNRHMKCHTDEKPFPCPYCDVRYSTKFYLVAHLKKGSCTNTLSPAERDESNVSVYYAPVVGNDVFLDSEDKLISDAT